MEWLVILCLALSSLNLYLFFKKSVQKPFAKESEEFRIYTETLITEFNRIATRNISLLDERLEELDHKIRLSQKVDLLLKDRFEEAHKIEYLAPLKLNEVHTENLLNNTNQSLDENNEPISENIPNNTNQSLDENSEPISENIPNDTTQSLDENSEPISENLPNDTNQSLNENSEPISENIPNDTTQSLDENSEPFSENIPNDTTQSLDENSKPFSENIPNNTTQSLDENSKPFSENNILLEKKVVIMDTKTSDDDTLGQNIDSFSAISDTIVNNNMLIPQDQIIINDYSLNNDEDLTIEEIIQQNLPSEEYSLGTEDDLTIEELIQKTTPSLSDDTISPISENPTIPEHLVAPDDNSAKDLVSKEEPLLLFEGIEVEKIKKHHKSKMSTQKKQELLMRYIEESRSKEELLDLGFSPTEINLAFICYNANQE